MKMTGRERFLTVLENKKPDRLPCQVHSWMDYYLRTYLNGMDQYQAYDYFGMDPVIYVNPEYIYDDKDLANWEERFVLLEKDNEGNQHWKRIISTPDGELVECGAYNQFTGWVTEHIIKTPDDFEIWNKYVPVPVAVDWAPVKQAKERIGDRGIVRGCLFDFGQGSPWQSFAGVLCDMQDAIYATFDDPGWVHYVLKNILEKKLSVIEHGGKIELDLVETGGGAGSNTVISPDLHREFCLPYDKKQHELIHEMGSKVVYHLCGGIMSLLDIVAQNGADGLETMTPASMGGDCDLDKADKQVGDKLFFIGGFDQNQGFENGNPEIIRKMVFSLFEACPNGGYIISPSDHFFFGSPDNIRAFVDAVRECTYN